MPLPVLIVFVTIFLGVLVASAVGWRFLETRRKKQVVAILKTVSGVPEPAHTTILRDLDAQKHTPVEWLLAHFDFTRLLGSVIKQAGLDWKPGRLILIMAVMGAFGAFVGTALPLESSPALRGVSLGAVGLALPYLYVARKRSRRMAAFEQQLPDALDFLARSMRAGHAFSISLEMMSDEMPEPLGLEFKTLFNEQNLGAPIEIALRNLTERVPLLDVRFFTSAVMMQRQTGGNLGEILTRLSHVIRERFRLKGQVKAASAHGRMTAGILTAMPVVTMMALLTVAPGYLEGMARDSDGKYLIFGSILGQILGFLVIRKIINIKV